MKIHELKLAPGYFDAIVEGRKRFEVRKDDRGGFEVGDILHLREWLGDCYSGNQCLVQVDYVLYWQSHFGVQKDHVIMSITVLAPQR